MKKYLPNILLAFASVASCFVLAEVAFRIWTNRHPAKPPVFHRPKYFYATEGGLATHEMRYSTEKPANTFRIAVVGDSFTFPTAMQYDDVFPKRLERMLNLNKPEPTQTPETIQTAQVLNFGLMGLNTWQEEKQARESFKYSPDLLILEITLNDIDPRNLHLAKNHDPELWFLLHDSFTEKEHPILAKSHLVTYMAKRMRSSRSLDQLISYHQKIYNNPKLWEDFTAAIKRIKEQTERRGTKFVAVLFPYFYTPIDERNPFLKSHDQITTFLTKEGIPNLDLTPAYTGITPEQLQIMPGKDTHPNEIAHRIAAEQIYDWLEKEGNIPESLKIHVRYLKRGLKPELMKPKA